MLIYSYLAQFQLETVKESNKLGLFKFLKRTRFNIIQVIITFLFFSNVNRLNINFNCLEEVLRYRKLKTLNYFVKAYTDKNSTCPA